MTSWVVADSGLLLASILPETHSSRAHALLQLWDRQGTLLAAPFLLHYEIVAVLRKLVYRGTLNRAIADQARDLLLAKPVHLMMDDDLLRKGYDLAARFNCPTAYDRTHFKNVCSR